MVKEEENLHKANIKRINASYYSQLTVDEITQENLKQMMSSKRPRDDADDNPGSSKRTHSDSDFDNDYELPPGFPATLDLSNTFTKEDEKKLWEDEDKCNDDCGEKMGRDNGL